MEFSETEIKALAQGDTKVFHKLYEHFLSPYVFARSFSLKPEEAEDIVRKYSAECTTNTGCSKVEYSEILSLYSCT
ncbi:MAG: hypothetical protein ACLU30_07135 [Odoribacter splanchnicus]